MPSRRAYVGRRPRATLAESNAAQVAKIRGILKTLSLDIATPAEAHEMLDLKGGDMVAF